MSFKKIQKYCKKCQKEKWHKLILIKKILWYVCCNCGNKLERAYGVVIKNEGMVTIKQKNVQK